MEHDKLAYMANQIGKFFVAQGEDRVAAGISKHIRKFRDPRMRSAIFAHADAGGEELDPLVMQALEKLKNAK